MAGTWESRTDERGTIRVRDSALLWTPIPMDLPAPTLQALITGWGNQHYPHGLTAATPFFTVQVKRYHYRLGHPHKRFDPIPLRPGAVVHVPIFCAGASLEVRTASYRLMFAIAHTGLH